MQPSLVSNERIPPETAPACATLSCRCHPHHPLAAGLRLIGEARVGAGVSARRLALVIFSISPTLGTVGAKLRAVVLALAQVDSGTAEVLMAPVGSGELSRLFFDPSLRVLTRQVVTTPPATSRSAMLAPFSAPDPELAAAPPHPEPVCVRALQGSRRRARR